MSMDPKLCGSSCRNAVEAASYCGNLLQSHNIDFEAMLAVGYSQFLKSGSTAIDIGAHAGYHYTKLKEVVGPTGRVIGFEPLPNFADHIVERHGGDAEVIQKALSTSPGRGTFLYMSSRPGESGFKERAYADERGAQRIEVEITTLDRELPALGRCDFIKIDTEGHELSALNGGQGLITRNRPIIAIEYGHPTYSLYGHTIDSLWHWAINYGYEISDIFGNLVASNVEWNSVCDVSYWDYFLIPSEKSDEWRRIFMADPVPLLFA